MLLADENSTPSTKTKTKTKTKWRELSIGSYLAITTTLVLLVVATLLVLDLASNTRRTALVARRASAETVTSLLAGSVWAALAFNDTEAVDRELANLRRADAVESAAVFAGDSRTPVATMTAVASAPPKLDRRPAGVTMTDDRIWISEVVKNPDGAELALVVVTFSLADENKAQTATKWSLAARGFILVAVTAALLMFIARKKVIRPLRRLVSVANRIERGDLRRGGKDDTLSALTAGEVTGNIEVRTLSHAFDRMSVAIADREDRLLNELKVAASLQMSILPNQLKKVVPGLSISAFMEPTTEVGGDYYDIIPTNDGGCWLAIGDVSGHGLGAGVVMMMLQSSIATLVRSNPHASPKDVECLVNEVLYENVRVRMKRRDHATLSILRYGKDGTVKHAGAHEDILVWRSKTNTVERIETKGTWVAAVKSIAAVTEESTFKLEPNDLMVLYTDGVTEARPDGSDEQFGLTRLEQIVESNAHTAPGELTERIVGALREWTPSLRDDITLVVMRHT